MKKLKFILTALFILLLTNHAFSQTMDFMVVASGGGQNAVYNDIARDKTDDIITLFKPNGEVVRDFDLAKYYEGDKSQEELEELTNKIVGSEIAIISIDTENNQLSFAIGDVTNTDIISPTSMSECDLDCISKTSIFDMGKDITIYMHNN